MTDHPMMECGHAANARKMPENIPSCVICAPDERAYKIASIGPDLIGRTAKCSCGASRPSSTELPFFEYRGPGSKQATESCVCGYYQTAHGKPHIKCKEFRPRGDMPDLFYCGHSGWD